MKDKEFDGFYKYKREHDVEVSLATIIGRLARGETDVKKLVAGPDDCKVVRKMLKADGVDKKDGFRHQSRKTIQEHIEDGYTTGQVYAYIKENLEDIERYAEYPDDYEHRKIVTEEAMQRIQKMDAELDIKLERPMEMSIRACITGNMTVDEIVGGTDGWEHYKRRIEEHVKGGEIIVKTPHKYKAMMVSNICTKSILTRAVEELQNDGRIGGYATKEELQRKLDEYDRLEIKVNMFGGREDSLSLNTYFDDITEEALKQLVSAVTGHDKVYVADNGSVLRCRVRLLKSLVDKYGANKYKKDIFDEAKKAFIKEYQRQQKYHRDIMKMAPLSMYRLDSILLIGSYEAEVIISLKNEVEKALE